MEPVPVLIMVLVLDLVLVMNILWSLSLPWSQAKVGPEPHPSKCWSSQFLVPGPSPIVSTKKLSWFLIYSMLCKEC